MTTDIIVIGGGVIGSAIAYNLTKRGKRVVLLEKKYLVNGASGACDQGILLQSKAPGDHLRLGIYSMEMYKGLEKELSRELDEDYFQWKEQQGGSGEGPDHRGRGKGFSLFGKKW